MHEAVIGMRKEDLDTPALLIDLDLMEKNIERISEFLGEHGVAWRPHAKCHKCPAIAHKQIAAGAIGVTCAKLGEAEVMAANGIRDILVANQIVGSQKLRRLISLENHANVMVVADHVKHIEAVGTAAQERDILVPILIEINIGLDRCGVEPGEPALALALKAMETKGVVFAGLMGYEGHILHVWPFEEKRRLCHEALDKLLISKELIEKAGIEVDIISAGGTGTYAITGAYPGITEVEAGGGIFMDCMYSEKCHVTDLDFALTVLATVTSRPTPDRVIVDAGLKTMSNQHGVPRLKDRDGVVIQYLSAEHGVLTLEKPQKGLEIGDKVEFIVGYTDTTNVLHDHFYGIRNGQVEVVWDLLARGRLR